MADELSLYRFWLEKLPADDPLHAELLAVEGNEKEIADRFYQEIVFGTAGLRGICGAGTNRMNRLTVGRATKGIADFILDSGEDPAKGVAIAYDCRYFSKEFSELAASILMGSGIHVYLFPSMRPTPELSFAIRKYGTVSGINMTASHNPKEYNGYKVYDKNGCQVCLEEAERIIGCVNAITDLTAIPVMDEETAKEAGLLHPIGREVLDVFCDTVKKQYNGLEKNDLHVVYTALHGTGNVPVRQVLGDLGFKVTIIPEQELPDGNFPTVISPNPENAEALSIGIKKCEELGADLVIGTDPDCDRVGIAVNTPNGIRIMTGNQVGALLVNYLAMRRKETLTPNTAVIKTIVTSELGAVIAEKYGLTVFNTLTGFKFIGEHICNFEKTDSHKFLMGYEESYGYLIGTHARDKDAVVASMMICEMAAYYKAEGKNLSDVLDEIYAEHGYYLDTLDSYTLKGKDGQEKIKAIMETLREKGTTLMPGIDRISDYKDGIEGLPKTNVLKYWMGGSWVAVRPSGTEPKIKIYYSVRGDDQAAAKKLLEERRAVFAALIGE
jgi:phosphoglucomutase